MTIRYLPTQATSQVMMPSHVVTLQIHYLHPFSIGQYARSFLSWCAIRTLMQQNQLEKPASFNNFCMEWLLCSVACPRVLGSLSCCFMLFIYHMDQHFWDPGTQFSQAKWAVFVGENLDFSTATWPQRMRNIIWDFLGGPDTGEWINP